MIDEKEFSAFDEDDFGFITISKSNSASIYISNGCFNNCSFCKVSFQKYPVKSVPINKVKETIDYCNDYNISTISFKGTNVCQYGLDIQREYLLPELIEYVEQKENIKELKLIGFAFRDAIQNNFHDTLKHSLKTTLISGGLESGSPRLLKLIQKGFSIDELMHFVESINEIKQKDFLLNVISGFPTETLEDIQLTLEVLKILNPQKTLLCRYTNSPFVNSNFYEQLSPIEIQEHTRIYSKVLQQRNMKHEIIGDGYKYNS